MLSNVGVRETWGSPLATLPSAVEIRYQHSSVEGKQGSASRKLQKIKGEQNMEPLVSAFATIVSLVGQFRAERDSAGQQGFNEFIEWLGNSHHDEIIQVLHLNTKATIGVKALLHQDRKIFLERLDNIDNVLAHIASAFEGYSEIVEGVRPQSLLSKQALSILRQFENSGASKLLEAPISEGPLFLFLDNSTGSDQLEIEETRFIDDDFSTLVRLGLLGKEYNSAGRQVYVFSRAASSLVRELDKRE